LLGTFDSPGGATVSLRNYDPSNPGDYGDGLPLYVDALKFESLNPTASVEAPDQWPQPSVSPADAWQYAAWEDTWRTVAVPAADSGDRVKVHLHAAIDAALAGESQWQAELPNVSGLEFWTAAQGGTELTPDAAGNLIDQPFSGAFDEDVWVCQAAGEGGDANITLSAVGTEATPGWNSVSSTPVSPGDSLVQPTSSGTTGDGQGTTTWTVSTTVSTVQRPWVNVMQLVGPAPSARFGAPFGVKWYLDPALIGKVWFQWVHDHYAFKDSDGTVLGTFDAWVDDASTVGAKPYTIETNGQTYTVTEAAQGDEHKVSLQQLVSAFVAAYRKQTGESVTVAVVEEQSRRDWSFADSLSYKLPDGSSHVWAPSPQQRSSMVNIMRVSTVAGVRKSPTVSGSIPGACCFAPVGVHVAGEIYESVNYDMLGDSGWWRITDNVTTNTTGKPVDDSEFDGSSIHI
jgi:hypothetical protein